jgi:hypothetical protein
MKSLVLFGFALLLPVSVSLIAAELAPNDREVDFVRDIQPILAAKCHACHGPDEQEGQLRLDARAIVFKGGVSGKLFDLGKGRQSLLVRRITEPGDERMPLDEERLSDREVDLIRRWIDQGARWPQGVGADVKAGAHWAYEIPQRSALPEVTNQAWARNPIDTFVLRKLEDEGLSPSPPADEAKRLRRVYLDLIGLPPSVEEVDAFLASSDPHKFAQAVDRLLASPQYGLRWARPWLDAARYADSNGYQADQYRNVWPYRDWVINAMNADMPFDQFTLEQLAGDLLPNATLDQKIATGFHRLTTCNVEAGVDPEENRTNQLIDRVNTTGTVWLGTSIECAQCHNHKYDPFTQRDYYKLFAYFNNTPLEVEGNGVTFNFVGPKMGLPLTAVQQQRTDELTNRREQLAQREEVLVAKRLEFLPAWEKQAADAGQDASKWHALTVVSFQSKGGASHELLDDNSVLVSGEEPDHDIYTVVAETNVQGITGFKLEALTDPSLPGNGPGRFTRPNFVLNEFQVTAAMQGANSKPIEVGLHGAAADYAQKQYPVAGAVDGDPATAWAIHPEFGKPHHATFLTHEPIGIDGATILTFTLDQHHGDCRTIGRLRLSAMTGTPSPSKLPDAIAKILAKSKRNEKETQELADYFSGLDPEIKKLRDQLAAVQKQLDAIKQITTLVMVEQDKPRMTTVFKRGNFLDKGETVSMGTPTVLPELASSDARDRRELAKWLTSRDNPLTARVAVNRWWAAMFGHGIVATLEDFGAQGEVPTHPKLIDWLAVELMESGWSIKHVHKQIVMSATYQQSSKLTPELLERDAHNKLYARGPRFRLPAETVRDNALAISGLLSTKMSGPPIYPPQPPNIWRHVGRNAPKYNTSQGNDRFRRGIYVVWRRSAPYPSFTNFDAPDRASCVVDRARTNTPLQALTLLNDPAYIEMSLAFAERIATAGPDMSVKDRIAYAIRLCVSRQPRGAEIEHLAEVFRLELERFEHDATAAEQLVGKPNGKVGAKDLAAWFYVANILLNLDETITKN